MKNVQSFDRPAVPGMAIHEMGTARMGHDPKTSVLNKWNQMHDVKNVFVTDGAFILVVVCVESCVELSHPLSPKQLTANLYWLQI